MRSKLAVFILGAATPWTALAADISAEHTEVIRLVEARAAAYRDVSRTIWEFAELGYHENKSSALLQQTLAAAGFDVQAGVAQIPTAFVASWGQGKPVIGILGEFDALPGLSQDAVPERKPLLAGAPGHGCGHNLLGSGAALAAVAIKEYLAEHHLPGTVRYYGTPAEEGGSGKVYMLRAGLFRDVDAVLHWHPGDSNTVTTGAGMLAVITAKFEFHGLASHAAAAPEKGRSALGARWPDAHGQRRRVPARARPQFDAHPLYRYQRRRGAQHRSR